MKKFLLLIAACLALPCAAAPTQTTQHYQFPAAPGSLSPPSTLTITQDAAGGPPAASGIVHDTPESLAQYQRCRTVSDRAAITNADRQSGVMQCLKALQERRKQGAVRP
ncbi:hypothetical protein [Bordetella sp. FB-8]|uniref:hypothetical protein n=1 Tax=Bordetella sp. FB-8 TaxID=1159870 RepID=UPI0003641EFA|nr:hypothetical protein [Bordetella sp. FB-8]